MGTHGERQGLLAATRYLIALMVAAALGSSALTLDWDGFGLGLKTFHLDLLGGAVLAAMLTAGLARIRRGLDAGAVPSAHGPWLVAFVITGCVHLLPVAILVIELAEWLFIERGRVPWYRSLTNGAVSALTCLGAVHFPGPALQIAAFVLINNILVAALSLSAGGIGAIRRMLDPRMQATAVGLCALGLPLGLLASDTWLITVATLPLIGVAHWATIRLQCAAPSTEGTGAIAAQTWRVMVETCLPNLTAGAVVFVECKPTSVVHDLIRSDVRPEDLIGELEGGFGIFLPMVGNVAGGAANVAARLRELLAAYDTSVGYAVKPDTSDDLTELVATARAHASIERSWRASPAAHGRASG